MELRYRIYSLTDKKSVISTMIPLMLVFLAQQRLLIIILIPSSLRMNIMRLEDNTQETARYQSNAR